MDKINNDKFNELLTRGVQDIVGREDLEKKLKSNEKMKIYIGADPNRPDIHIGHAVAIRKLRKFQELGHKIIFLIGDFTAQIGDPTGKDEARQQLSPAEVKKNAKTYRNQISKILDFKGKNKAEIKYNSDWNKKLKFQGLIELASNFTVQQFLERDMYQKRIKEGKPISLHEFFYPLMQAYDSVFMDVDMEVGGNDQLFNMLCGRTLMQKLKNKNKIVMTFQMLEGTDGRKMSKSYDNYVGVNDLPNDMFGKVMSITDDLIIKYFMLCTDLKMSEIKELENKMKSGENPRNLKSRLAYEIVSIYHGEQYAKLAQCEFDNVFKNKEKPADIKKVSLGDDKDIINLLYEFELVTSKTEARKMIEQNAVKVNDEKITDMNFVFKKGEKYLIQVGKRRFLEIE
ncbi:MAG: tyrosine--tRNA ligase [Patescibacteria group bacterium]|nr:tyrosine--tRNA ligase [Patescibacteria group bacterium]MDD4304167.1 tyrosine--tRNA ligase [Patescibacteria group bacterium]MDD4695199.1 tyrosine--tRNA ligase [Patescibacteria group bacterium]